MGPYVIARLPNPIAPLSQESAAGFMNRLLSLNGGEIRDALNLAGANRRRNVSSADAAVFSSLSGVPKPWFDSRLPQEVARDRWTEVELFGLRWRCDWILRGQRQQVCPVCLVEGQHDRLEWDLLPYCACHIHEVLLQDSCQSCGKTIFPDRPSLEVCSCEGFISISSTEMIPAPPSLVRWCAWLASKLDPVGNLTPPSAGGGPALCDGASPDGAYRLVQALAGGPRAMRGEVMNGDSPWLSTASMAGLMTTGLAALEELAKGRRASRTPDKGTADALSEQVLRGVTGWDRALAAKLFAKLNVRAKWRTVRRCYHEQLDLFEERP